LLKCGVIYSVIVFESVCMIKNNPNIVENNGKKDTGTGAPADDLPIKAAFIRYDSPFTRLIAPLIATRYLWPAIEAINPRNFLKKGEVESNPNFWRKISLNFTALSTGATFLGIIGMYSKNTLNDIKSLYSEAVGYELGKDKKDVTLTDIFIKSENSEVKITCAAYANRTLARVATASTFFVPWHHFRGLKNNKPKYEANANAGIGAIGIYLLGEGLLRDQSFFDAEQHMASTAINHTRNNIYEVIQPENIFTILMLHHKNSNKNYQIPEVDSEAGKNAQCLANRIASLMNQTYKNTTNIENANFTIGKLNFLIGFGLLDKPENNLSFVELANKSSDMRDVKTAATAIENGQNSHKVFHQFGIDTNALLKRNETITKYAQQSEKNFRNSVGGAEKKAISPQTHLDFATKKINKNLDI
jgi:hypothetical protein